MSSSRPKLTPASDRTAILKQDIARHTTDIDSIQARILQLKRDCAKKGQTPEIKGDCAVDINNLNHQVLPMIRQCQLYSNELTRIEAAAKKGGKPKTQNRKRNKSSHRQSRKVRRRRTSRTR